jgi:hypothetical protein
VPGILTDATERSDHSIMWAFQNLEETVALVQQQPSDVTTVIDVSGLCEQISHKLCGEFLRLGTDVRQMKKLGVGH